MGDDQRAVPAEGAAVAGGGLSEQRVTWAELLFDLVWVFGLTQVAATLAASHGAGEAARTLVLLAPLWWGWVGVALLGNAAGAVLDSTRGRLLLFSLAACGLAMTVAIPQAFGAAGPVFAIGYFMLRLLLWVGMRRQPQLGGVRLEPFSVSAFVSGPLFVIGGLLGGPWRLSLWVAASVVAIFSPVMLGHRLDHVKFETSHLPERFGLFVIIGLGETVVAVGSQASAKHLGALTLTTMAVSFLIILGLWWTYFHFGASAIRHSLESDPVQLRIVRDVFTYGHFLYVVAIICVAVGFKNLLAHPIERPHHLPALLLAPGVGLYLLGFCYSRWRMFGAATVPRFFAGLTCFGIAAIAPLLPALALAVIVVVLLASVNGLEAWWVASRRPLMVLHVPRRLRRPPPA